MLVSDAGTPAVSDPCSRVVHAALQRGLRVSPIVGPSALAAAISVCGFDTDRVLFVGFVPSKGQERRVFLDAMIRERGCVVFFETPHRMRETCDALALLAPTREACICRELTKIHEEIVRTSLEKVASWAHQKDMRGELTIVLGPALEIKSRDSLDEESTDTFTQEKIDLALKRCFQEGMTAKEAVRAVSLVLDQSKRVVYQQALKQTKISDLSPL